VIVDMREVKTTTGGGTRWPQGRSNWRRYAAYLRQPPELTVAWHDAETGARAWLVVNAWRGGAAGGGTRMRLGVEPREVVYLAKAMQLKFALAGPAIGGAKSGIDFDPTDPRKPEVLERWWHSILPLLRDRYGTGGDLNVDEMVDVIPAFARLGMLHPQQGIVTGHLQPDAARFDEVMQRMAAGVEAPLCHARPGIVLDGTSMTVADMITGYGVAYSARRLLEKQGRPIEGARVLVEGFGNVGAACALYLARAGARIVAVSDARQTLVEPAGLDAPAVEWLVRHRDDKLLPHGHPRVRPGHHHFWGEQADIFVCAAISQSVSEETLGRLEAAGVSVIACGANQPFRERAIGSTAIAQQADRRFSIVPDIVANCGMARTFSFLMEPSAEPTCDAIVAAVERTISNALDEIVDRASMAGGGRGSRAGIGTGLLAASLGLALDRIEAA
jgi:glutamate dehydrogenase/leucine dehydrogenase